MANKIFAFVGPHASGKTTIITQLMSMGIHCIKTYTTRDIKEKDPNACVIMCSAMGQQAMVIEAIQSGAKDFIVKPFQAERVLEAVKKVIG